MASLGAWGFASKAGSGLREGLGYKVVQGSKRVLQEASSSPDDRVQGLLGGSRKPTVLRVLPSNLTGHTYYFAGSGVYLEVHWTSKYSYKYPDWDYNLL